MEEHQLTWDNTALTAKVIELEKELAKLLARRKVAQL
jgi:hypothetical protein